MSRPVKYDTNASPLARKPKDETPTVTLEMRRFEQVLGLFIARNDWKQVQAAEKHMETIYGDAELMYEYTLSLADLLRATQKVAL